MSTNKVQASDPAGLVLYLFISEMFSTVTSSQDLHNPDSIFHLTLFKPGGGGADSARTDFGRL